MKFFEQELRSFEVLKGKSQFQMTPNDLPCDNLMAISANMFHSEVCARGEDARPVTEIERGAITEVEKAETRDEFNRGRERAFSTAVFSATVGAIGAYNCVN